MLKTTDQQDAEPLNFSNNRLVSNSEPVPTLEIIEDLELERKSSQNIQALVDEFTSETKRRRRRFWVSWTLTVATIAPLFGLIEFLITRAPVSDLPILRGSSLLLALISFMLPISATRLVRPSKRQRSITDILIASNHVRAIDPLMAGTGTANRATRDLMVTALIQLLPRLTENDSKWLSAASQRALLIIAGWANSGMMRAQYGTQWVDFVISTLKALANVGDSRALKPVTALAAGVASTADAKRIQQAAVECLEPLQKRIAEDRVGEHLLRSSTQPTLPLDTLLIPAIETASNANELPRPSARG